MKTDYTALERLRETCENADTVQRELLFELLRKNKNTEKGRKHGFFDIKSIADFQSKIPVSEYDDYADDISRIINGGENILTAESPIYFCISSGTTGGEKYLPLTETDIKLQYIYAHGAVFGTVREYYRDLNEKYIFEKIFQVGEFAKTHMTDGRMNGIRSGCVYQWLDKNGEFDASDYCVPKEILFPERLEDLLYIKVRFALAERDLTAIHGVFVYRVAGVIEYILRNWERLLDDMEKGTVSADIPEHQKEYLARKLPPNPERARELRGIPRGNFSAGIIKKIWKNIKYILAIGGGAFSYYTEKMLEYAGGVPIHHYAYAATEGVFGIAEKMNTPDRYILFPEAGFFEFLPINDKTSAPLLLCEIEVGKQYEMLFTNRSGLYRYRLGDVIEAVGKYGKAPVVKFCYRRNQIINIAGEKSNQQQFDMAIKRFTELINAEIRGYCVVEDVSGIAPRYLFYMECGNIPKNADKIFEECLCGANPEYKWGLNMREIEPLRIEFLREGSFKRYEEMLAESGKPMAQSKMPHFPDSEEKRAFFAKQTIKGVQL